MRKLLTYLIAVFMMIPAIMNAEDIPMKLPDSDNQIIKITELSLSVTIPSNYVVFTRTMNEKDPALSSFGFTKESLSSMMESTHAYLVAFDISGLQHEIYISMVEIGGTPYHQMSDMELEKTIPGYEAGIKASGSIPSNTEVYHHSQTKFIRHDTVRNDSRNSTTAYGIQYATRYDGKYVVVTLRTDSNEVRTKIRHVLEEIVESIYFEKLPISSTSGSLTQDLKEENVNPVSDRKENGSSILEGVLGKGFEGLISGFILGVIAAIVGFIKRRKNRRNQTDNSQQTRRNRAENKPDWPERKG